MPDYEALAKLEHFNPALHRASFDYGAEGNPDLPTVFVLHVRKGADGRDAHIRRMMQKYGISFEYMLDGDIIDMKRHDIAVMFKPYGSIPIGTAAASCAAKHLLSYRQIVERNLPGALILEDDIVLYKRFGDLLRRSVAEVPANEAAIVAFDESRLRFVPRSKRRKGQVIYPGKHDLLAGAYYITNAGARAILDYIKTRPLDYPIDIMHTVLTKEGVIKYYWSYPCGAVQGSFNGMFGSSISTDRTKAIFWQLRRYYRRLLYFLR